MFKDSCNLQYQFLDQDALQILSDIKTLYSMIFSDQTFIQKCPDIQFYQIQLLFQKFFQIYQLMRPSNRLKTSYLCDKLVKNCQDVMKSFLQRFPSIKKQNMRIDPENGIQFLQL